MYFNNLDARPNEDLDNDGFSNDDEQEDGTDPTRFDIGPISIYAEAEITWRSVAGTNYQVQWCSRLDTNTWKDLGSPVIGSGGEESVLDSTRWVTQRFYRVSLAPEDH